MTDVERALQIRDDPRYGLGIDQAKRAVRIADERFEGDLHLGALWVCASSLAVYIHGDRGAWNEAWVRRRAEGMK